MEYLGKFRAIVERTDDPENRGRITVHCPDVMGDTESDWCEPCLVGISDDGGDYVPLKTGDGVWVEFQNGNMDYPVYSGSWWSENALSGVNKKERVIAYNGASITFKEDGTISIKNADGSVMPLSSQFFGMQTTSSSTGSSGGGITIVGEDGTTIDTYTRSQIDTSQSAQDSKITKLTSDLTQETVRAKTAEQAITKNLTDNYVTASQVISEIEQSILGGVDLSGYVPLDTYNSSQSAQDSKISGNSTAITNNNNAIIEIQGELDSQTDKLISLQSASQTAASTMYVNEAIANAKLGAFKIASSRPETGEEGITYLIGTAEPYQKFIYEGGVWHSLGSTDNINLADFVRTSELNSYKTSQQTALDSLSTKITDEQTRAQQSEANINQDLYDLNVSLINEMDSKIQTANANFVTTAQLQNHADTDLEKWQVIVDSMEAQNKALSERITTLEIDAGIIKGTPDTTQTYSISNESPYTVPVNPSGYKWLLEYSGADFLLGSSGHISVNDVIIYDNGGILGLKVGDNDGSADVKSGDILTFSGLTSITLTPYV